MTTIIEKRSLILASWLSPVGAGEPWPSSVWNGSAGPEGDKKARLFVMWVNILRQVCYGNIIIQAGVSC